MLNDLTPNSSTVESLGHLLFGISHTMLEAKSNPAQSKPYMGPHVAKFSGIIQMNCTDSSYFSGAMRYQSEVLGISESVQSRSTMLTNLNFSCLFISEVRHDQVAWKSRTLRGRGHYHPMGYLRMSIMTFKT